MSVTPLDALEPAVASAEIAPAQESPVVDLTALAVSNATTENIVEVESNNTKETAQDLGVLTQITTVDGVAEKKPTTGYQDDWYKIALTGTEAEGSYIRLTTDSGLKLGSVQLFLKSASDASTVATSVYDSAANVRTISLEDVAPGEYYVHLYSSSSNDIPYSLTIDPPKPETDDQYETNDSRETATDLGYVGSLAINAKAAVNNVDCYKFTLLAQGTADNYVNLNYVKASNTQLNFRIYNESNELVFSNVQNWASSRVEKVSLEGFAAGDYYVEIVVNTSPNAYSKYALTINAPKVAPSAPTNFKAIENVSEATSKITKNETTLAWDAVENATYYEIRYTTDVDATNPTWSAVEKVDGLSHAISLAYNTTYKYQVRAVTVYNDSVVADDTAFEGAWTDVVFSTVDAPVAPTQLTVSKLDPETHTVKLTWKDVVDENEYQVLLFNAGNEVVDETDLAANQTSWTPNYQFDLGGSYRFEIRAKNNAGYGDFAALDFTVEDVPAQPTDLTATVDAAFNATLTWIAPTATENENEAVTGYEVAILDENDEWQVVAALAADATEWTTDAPLDPAATHALAVRAVNEYGVSAWTTVELATPEAPSTLVTTADDVVDAYDGEISLREAIQYAEAGATIAFADDVETITLAGTQLEITKALTIDGGENGVTIDGAQKSRVFFIDATDGTVALQNLTVAGGKEYRAGGGYVDGSEAPFPDDANLGGVYVGSDATATFANVTISDNEAKNSGGGVYLASNATATFTNVEISGNAARGAMGGGVYVYSGVKATFTDVTFTENTASVDSGGAAYVRGQATFTNVAIVGNTARDGAGVQISGAGTANFTNVAIIGNLAPYDGETSLPTATYGGGDVRGEATFTNVTIAENRSGYGGV